MYQVLTTIRRIPPEELPELPRLLDEDTGADLGPDLEALPSFGLFPLGDDYYSVVEQYHSIVVRHPATGQLERVWHRPLEDHNPRGPRWPEQAARSLGRGEMLSCDADVQRRYDRLPGEHYGAVMRADVVTGRADVEASLAEQEAAIAKNVGPVDGQPLVDLTTPEALVTEACRLADRKGVTGVQRERLTMAMVDDAEHVVVAENIIPHGWAGDTPGDIPNYG